MDYSFGRSSYEAVCIELYHRVTGFVNDLTNRTHSRKDFEILKQFDVDVYSSSAYAYLHLDKSYLAKEVSTGKQFLLKVFTKSKFLNHGLLDGFIGEVEILVRLQYGFID